MSKDNADGGDGGFSDDLGELARDRWTASRHDPIRASEARARNAVGASAMQARDDARSLAVREEAQAAAAERAQRIARLKKLRLG